MTDKQPLGISGKLAARFQNNPLTPILAILGLLLGMVGGTDYTTRRRAAN